MLICQNNKMYFSVTFHPRITDEEARKWSGGRGGPPKFSMLTENAAAGLNYPNVYMAAVGRLAFSAQGAAEVPDYLGAGDDEVKVAEPGRNAACAALLPPRASSAAVQGAPVQLQSPIVAQNEILQENGNGASAAKIPAGNTQEASFRRPCWAEENGHRNPSPPLLGG